MRASVVGWCRGNVDQLVTVVALVVLLVSAGSGAHQHGHRDVVLAVLSWVPLLIRSRRPLTVAVVSIVLDTLRIAANGDPGSATLSVATVVALYSLHRTSPPTVVWSLAAVSAVSEFTVSVLAAGNNPSAAFLYLNLPVLGAGLGQLAREHRQRLALADRRAEDAEHDSETEAQRRVVAERLRIARELHDVLAHHLTVVNAQAGVAHHLLRTDLDSAEKALAGITANTRAALDELRSTLGLLRSESDRVPTPGLGELPALVDGFSAAGTDVTVRVDGTPRQLGDIAQLAFHRIVQEALTNVSRHAPGSPARVGIDWTDATVTLTITNAVSGSGRGAGTGHGITGMRERAASAGGTLACGPTADGGFLVEATLPVPRPVPPDVTPDVTRAVTPAVSPAGGPVPAVVGGVR